MKLPFDQSSQPLKWSFLLEATNRVIPPLTYLVLTQILTPEDFGIFTASVITVNLLLLFTDFGLGKALIQTNQSLEKSANVIFWISILLGIVIYAILFWLTPLIAVFFNDLALVVMLRVLGIQLLFNSLSVCPQMMLIREMGFRKLFWSRLASTLLPVAISVPMAFSGLGGWALVGGTLTGSFVNTVFLWSQTEWRPKTTFDPIVAKPLLKFGIWTLLEGLGTWFFYWGDNLIVGKVFGSALLGSYQVSWSLVSFAFALLVGSFMPVLYTLLSRIQDDMELVKSTFERVNTFVVTISLPLALCFFLTGDLVQQSLFRTGWGNIGLLIRVVGLLSGFSWLVGINYEVYRAIGRPDINTKISFFLILCYAPIYILTSQMGFKAFVAGRFAATLLGVAVQVSVAQHILHFEPMHLWWQSKSALFGCGIMAVSVIGVIYLLKDLTDALPIISFLIAILVSFVSYCLSLWAIDRTLASQLLNLGKQILK